MTKREIANMAKRMDEETRLLIDKEVEERLEILKQGDLNEDELKEMEECLYASLIIQEFLNGEYDLLEEERQELFDHMEEMYNKYSDLLVRARIEEKVGKKKRMALELMKIREKLMQSKEEYKNIKHRMKENREDYKKFNDATKKSNLKEIAKLNKTAKKGSEGISLGIGISGTSATNTTKKTTSDNNGNNNNYAKLIDQIRLWKKYDNPSRNTRDEAKNLVSTISGDNSHSAVTAVRDQYNKTPNINDTLDAVVPPKHSL